MRTTVAPSRDGGTGPDEREYRRLLSYEHWLTRLRGAEPGRFADGTGGGARRDVLRALPAAVQGRLHDVVANQPDAGLLVALAATALTLDRYAGDRFVIAASGAALGAGGATIWLPVTLCAAATPRELLGVLEGALRGGMPYAAADPDALLRRVAESDAAAALAAAQFGVGARLDDVPAGTRIALAFDDPAAANAVALRCDGDVLDAELAQRFLAHWIAALALILQQPDRPLSELDILAADEPPAFAPCAEHREFPSDDTLLHRFARQVARAPGAPAVRAGDVVLTYAELDAAAGQLAARLRRRGVAPGALVGLAVGRSAELVVAVLGILKAGAGYLPLDAEWPAERSRAVLADGAAAVVVCDAEFERRLALEPPAVVRVDDQAHDGGDAHASEPPGDAPLVIGADATAYVIFTSGSTGRPKGVVVSHRNVVRLFDATEAWFRPSTADVWTLFHSIAFDFSVWELWGALLYGGTVVVVPWDVTRSPDAFRALLTAERVTMLSQTPSAFGALIAADRENDGELALRFVVFGGEALDLASLAPWFARHGDACPVLVNMYGITETTVHVTYRALAASDAARTDSVIGTPLPDLTLHLLDARMRPVPAGAPGELYVGGAGLAAGYLGNPALTAERFVCGPDGCGRLYRTGDLARRLGDGEIAYLGRADDQVKIRGFRIELGEVQAAVVRQRGVAAAAVVMRDSRLGEKQIVAYVVPGADGFDAAVLAAHVAAALPSYMVPAAIVPLERLPLTPNGKLDRAALPAPPDAPAREVERPHDPLVALVADVFAEMLGLAAVAADDDFFALGGHSLRAMPAVARLRRATGANLPLRALFDARTPAAVAERIRAAGRARHAPEFAVQPRTRRMPLSYAQARLWFLDGLDGGGATYAMPAALALDGALDEAALRAALSEIVRRHEVLRSRFGATDGMPWQEIVAAHDVALRVVDLSASSDAVRDDDVRRLTHAEATAPFDLSSGELLRATLVRTAPERHVLLLTIHHIAADAWSLNVLVRELAALYAAFVRGEPSPLAPLAFGYADFAAWQRADVRGAASAPQESYWRERLAGAPAVLELPTDRPRSAVLHRRGDTVAFALDDETGAAVTAFARSSGATVFMVLLAAYAVVLARWSGQRDVVVGTPIANRTRDEVEPLIGFFLNTLPLRIDLGGDPDGRELLQRVRDTALGAYANADVPFERLVEMLQPERSLDRTPLFQTMFVLQHDPLERLELPGLSVDVVPTPTSTAKFDLTLELTAAGSGFAGTLEYDADLFERATAERFCTHLARCVAALVRTPDIPVAAIAIVSDGERRELVVDCNATARDARDAALLPELVARSLASACDAPAVVCDDGILTYAQLDAESNRLARRLIALGVGPESLVGIALERSPAMVVALLAALKAGAAYLPLDPQYPPARLAFMIADAQPSVVVTTAALVSRVPCAATIVLDDPDERARLAALAGDDAGAERRGALLASHPACVIYTSGSTGTPKGVMTSHGALINVLRAVQEQIQVAPRERVAALAPVSFDIAAVELWLPLLAGASIELMSRALASDGPALAARLVQRDVAVVQATPATWRMLFAAGWTAQSGQRLISTGEALDATLAGVLSGGPAPAWNFYGPSETTVFSTLQRLEPGASWVPIGRPIDNTQVYVLDARLEPVPIGVAGELYIAGAGLARGYVKRAAQTAERFVADPFATDGARMYRTGDVARRRADGVLEYLGRVDAQVKLRGVRIELGEIEAALTAHPAVAHAAATVREDRPGDRRLVAYVVASAGAVVPAAHALRAHLAQRLPDAMLPTAFVELASLPQTPNGKLDRKALPVPDAPNAVTSRAPRTPAEELLCALWCEVLGVPRAGIDDDFFALGGHSLLATQLVSRVRDAFGAELSVRALFEQPTPARLSEAIAALRGTAAAPLQISPRPARLPLSYGQRRLWFLERFDEQRGVYNMPLALRLTGALDAAALECALNDVIARHEILRTVYVDHRAEPFQRIIADAHVSLPVETLDESSLGAALEAAAQERIRFVARPAGAREALSQRRRARAAGGAAPHRGRRVVDGRARARAQRGLPRARVGHRADLRAAGAAVRGLCGVASARVRR